MSNLTEEKGSEDRDMKKEKDVEFIEEEAMMNMFASVWVKTEVADDDVEEDNSNDLDYKPGILERLCPRNPGTKKRKGYHPKKVMKCDQCDYTTIYRNCLELHVRAHITPKPYACDLCSYKSKYPTSLNRHVLVHHEFKELGKQEEFKCPACDYTTHYKWNLYAHMRKHKNEKQYSCEHCTYATAYKHNYLKHSKVHNKKEVKFKCDKCPFITKFEGHITRHLAKIHNEVLDKAKKCDLCDFSTLTGWRLNIHKQRSKQKAPLKCAYCNFETSYRCESKKHKTTHYNELYTYKEVNSYDLIDGKVQATRTIELLSEQDKNSINDKITSPDAKLDEQMKLNTDENGLNIEYKLNTCENGSNSEYKLNTDENGSNSEYKLNTDENGSNNGYKLNTNENRLNTDYSANTDWGMQNFNAEFLNQQYKNNQVSFSDLSYPDINYQKTDPSSVTCKSNEVQISNHKNYLIDPKCEVDWHSIQVLESDNRERPFQCIQCKYSSKFKASVQRHFQRHHTGNQHRPYKCVNCDFTTKTKDQIALHNKRSQSETNMQCTVCTYTTNFKCQFVIHQRSHYAHKCNICNYSCRHKFEIQRHFATMHLGDGIKCRFCDFKATRKESILCHETIHTGDKPFKCDLCSYSSVRKCLLDIHFKKYHSDVKKEIVIVSESKIDALKVAVDFDYEKQAMERMNIEFNIDKS